MLILCEGGDTFSARQKAQGLERAFIEKYDAGGMAVERLPAGKEAIEALVQRVGHMGLFATRRFLRASNLISDCPKAKQKLLAQVLAKDVDGTIVVSIEEEILKEDALNFLEGVKIIKYSFPERSGASFQAWVEQQAVLLHVSDADAVRKISVNADGDSWLAWNELSKLAAGGMSDLVSPAFEVSIFDQADAFLQQSSGARRFLYKVDSLSEILPAFMSQARAALRARDGAIDGLHPFVVKKMKMKAATHAEEKAACLLRALFCQRAGYAADTEAIALL